MGRWTGRGDGFITGDLVEVVEDERLEIREGQAQMVKFQDTEEGSQEEKRAVMAFPPMLEVIVDNRKLKMKENPDVGITETPVLKAKEANKIRDIYRGFAKFQKNGRNRTEKEERNWERMGTFGWK